MFESAFEFVFTNSPIIGVWLVSMGAIIFAVWKISKLVNSVDNIAIKMNDLNNSLTTHIIDDKNNFNDLHLLNNAAIEAAKEEREKIHKRINSIGETVAIIKGYLMKDTSSLTTKE